jgi:hypothetical protein
MLSLLGGYLPLEQAGCHGRKARICAPLVMFGSIDRQPESQHCRISGRRCGKSRYGFVSELVINLPAV